MAKTEKSEEKVVSVDLIEKILPQSVFKVLFTQGKLPEDRAKYLSKLVVGEFIGHISQKLRRKSL